MLGVRNGNNDCFFHYVHTCLEHPYFYTSGSRRHLCQVIHKLGLGWLDVGVWKCPAMESLKALHCIFTVCHHLDIVNKVKKVLWWLIQIKHFLYWKELNRWWQNLIILPDSWQLLLLIDFLVQMTEMTCLMKKKTKILTYLHIQAMS